MPEGSDADRGAMIGMRTEALLAHATDAIERGSGSFAAAARLFDAHTREGAVMLYAWCRHCDDAIDAQQSGHGLLQGDRSDAPARLARLRSATRAACRGEAVPDAPHAALAQVCRRHGVPERLPLAHLDGFAMDVEQRAYRTLDDTLQYCYGVAGVVGIMMAMVMGVRDEATLDRACDLGLAFQLTNIARDVVDDARIGRVYLPADWLAEAGVPVDEVAQPRHREALAAVVARLLDAAEPYYDSALVGVRALPPRSAWAVATARGVYRQIGLQVRAAGAHAWDGRVSTSRAQKLRHAGAGALHALVAATRRALHWPVTPAPRTGLWTRP